jgi:hypothetical protein
MMVLAHEVAGRLRFVSPALKDDRRQASRLVRQVRAVPGVTNVLVRRTTGSLIVLHDGASATRQAILRTLPIASPAGEERGQPLLDEFVETAAQHLLNIAAKGVIAALL